LSRRPGADDGERAGNPGVGELGGGGDLDDAHARAVQLLDDRRRQRVVTADDDVALHVLERIVAKLMSLMSLMSLSRRFHSFL
jgi:hypothetical protein